MHAFSKDVSVALNQQTTHLLMLISKNQILINPKRTGTQLSWFNKVNIMVADALAPCVARTSAPMIFTK